MSKQRVSRRSFLRSTAVSSTGAALATLPAADPLWTAGNILITSHTSARSPQTDGRVRNLFCENFRRYVNGLPLLNVVDKERGY